MMHSKKSREIKAILEEFRAIDREYEYGKIGKEKYEELRRKYEEKLKMM